ncbi:unnamed protein product [Owenia fusiformis]|uniref:Uncharacterized protein n=1 Tax=Owenia fusiformis TaxID=6347 RepID=A0A8J1XXH5_OWEFU|nr:unnamed protein product [Owenia fusiformis]
MPKDNNIFMVRVPRAVEEPNKLTHSPMPPKPERKIKSAPPMRSKSPVKNKHLFYGKFKPVKVNRDVKDVSQLDFRNRSWSVCGGNDTYCNSPTLYGHDNKRTEKLWNIQDVALTKREVETALPRRSFYNCHDLTLKRAGIDPKKIEQDAQKKTEVKTKKKTKKRRRKKSKQLKIAKASETQSEVNENIVSDEAINKLSLQSTNTPDTNTPDQHTNEVSGANNMIKTINETHAKDWKHNKSSDKGDNNSDSIAVSRASSEHDLISSRIENEANKADDNNIQTLMSEQTDITPVETKETTEEEKPQCITTDKDDAIANASSVNESNTNSTADSKATDVTRESNKELELVIADIVKKTQAAQRLKTGKTRDVDFTVLLKYLLEVKRCPMDYWRTKHKLSGRNNSGTTVETYQTDIPTESLIVQAAYEVTLMSRMLNPETFRRRKAEAEAKTKSASGATVKLKDNRINVDIPSTVNQEYSSRVEKYRAEVEQWLTTLTTIQMTTARDMALKVMGEKGRSDMNEMIRRRKAQDLKEQFTSVF